jgi:GNAT superfamily N-acetyltransferase
MAIRTLLPPPWKSLEPLIDQSLDEGFGFLARLRDEYESGRTRFDLPGETLFSAFDASALVGIGGLTRDPYVSDRDIGRVRHVYVMPGYRRRGFGRVLLAAIEQAAHQHFVMLTLRADSLDGKQFYERIGYVRANMASATHYRPLSRVT